MKSTPIAVVGMAGLFPGALDLETFWHNIRHKISAAGEIPAHRWIEGLFQAHGPAAHPDKAYSTRACLMDEADFRIHPDAMGLSADEIQHLDPLHHMVLSTGSRLLKTANFSGIDRDRISISLAAIALPTQGTNQITTAVLETVFKDRLVQRRTNSPVPLSPGQYTTGRVCGFPAALMARAFDFKGPLLTLDAACASSLYAVKIACDQLQAGEVDAAVAGGVSRPDNIFAQVGFSQLRALSPSGRCAPFDATADGLVVGEGCGMVLLKRLPDALAAGDRIYGTIAGIGLSNDMRGNLLAPDQEGQVRAMKSAYTNAGWSPSDVDLIECHGAGTPVGDMVELNALTALWQGLSQKKGKTAIGSVKSVIGHLLTGAGIAGMIKTLLALNHKILPPSANFSQAPPKSPLHNSPFAVLTDAEKWPARGPEIPRRAAISAFGFGGINGHVLLEEWRPDATRTLSEKSEKPESAGHIFIADPSNSTPVAIVGMATGLGDQEHLAGFQQALFSGTPLFAPSTARRFKGDMPYTGLKDLCGGFQSDIRISPKDFHIPPNEIPDMLPQQVWMLKIAADALRDAGMPLRGKRPRMAGIMGIGFDFETTNFFLRWRLPDQVREWLAASGADPDDPETAQWIARLVDAYGPPLTATRTLGHLGSIVASRIAREFQFGGPSYTVSSEEGSGLSALKLAQTALARNEIDAALVGAVEFGGDIRNLLMQQAILPYSAQREVRAFDAAADGSLPGEGAAALVVKRYADAVKDHDRIYAKVAAVGSGVPDAGKLSTDTGYVRSLEDTFSKAGVPPHTISLITANGSGHPDQDDAEAAALNRFFERENNGNSRMAVASATAIAGRTGAVAGLASVVFTALCLYQEIVPPLPGYQTPKAGWHRELFHIPKFAHYWARNRADGPRRALAGTITLDGICAHALLEEALSPDAGPLPETLKNKVALERKKPAGWEPVGLFAVSSDSKQGLCRAVEKLKDFVRRHHSGTTPMEVTAWQWHQAHPADTSAAEVICFVAGSRQEIETWSEKAIYHIQNRLSATISARSGFAYTPEPLGPAGKIAFVFPGSGNHYLGMGRETGVCWPEILREMDCRTKRLKDQMLPDLYVPCRLSWEEGWETEAAAKIAADATPMIFGQVFFGDVKTQVIRQFDIPCHGVMGYSLGQSVGYFATGAWPDRGQMLDRIARSDLFTTQLAGPCESARKAWQVPVDQALDWTVAVVNRPAGTVKAAMAGHPTARLLIVNTHDQCVIGGRQPDVAGVIRQLNCESVFLDGVVTVHCDAAEPVADAYEDLHRFPVTAPEKITYYSCADGRAHVPTTESAASSIRRQATSGFDFTKTVDAAHADGFRIFVEMGPHASCTGMIRAILKDKPHCAVSACFRGENDYLTLLKCLGTIAAEHVAVNLDFLYGQDAVPDTLARSAKKPAAPDAHVITLPVGGHILAPEPFKKRSSGSAPEPEIQAKKMPDTPKAHAADRPPASLPVSNTGKDAVFTDFMAAVTRGSRDAARAHERFLAFSSDLQENYAKTVAAQARMVAAMTGPEMGGMPDLETVKALQTGMMTMPLVPEPVPASAPPQQEVFSRKDCMAFAIGRVADVLGPEFAVVDTYEKRVRLPDEPLMLVDRITAIEGEKLSLGSGRIITEHDVRPDAWYLDAGRAPVCISVEAGQADLFLCSYLGIDHEVKGKRAYRLLDATVEFHRGLPRPGETITYDIRIDRFVRQGETYLFFFNFTGHIGDHHLITMTNGCAGFFTEEEVKNSGGIIKGEKDRQPRPGVLHDMPGPFVAFEKKKISSGQLNALRQGDLEACFGPAFAGLTLAKHLRIPAGPMKLIDRIVELNPEGGRYGLGKITAEADIHPDDWFLTCHFMDDMVMPGTLMYECCAHTFRVLLQQMGWISSHPDACYEPLPGNKSVLKCRGPVTPATQHVHYEVEVKEIGSHPEPYAIADAHMYADGHCIVLFNDISLKLSNVRVEELSRFWSNHKNTAPLPLATENRTPVFSRRQLEDFALGSPSAAFGKPYAPFDKDRFIARLPNPPLLLMDRVITCAPAPWVMTPDGWLESAYDISEDAWYFTANANPTLPHVILLEIALQPCGWLAAYMGSALKSEKDLLFRNLDGDAVLHRDIRKGHTPVTVQARCTQVSAAGDMIIQQYDFAVKDTKGVFYEGHTTFGFFTRQAMAHAEGPAGCRCPPGPGQPHGPKRKAFCPAAPEGACPARCPCHRGHRPFRRTDHAGKSPAHDRRH